MQEAPKKREVEADEEGKKKKAKKKEKKEKSLGKRQKMKEDEERGLRATSFFWACCLGLYYMSFYIGSV